MTFLDSHATNNDGKNIVKNMYVKQNFTPCKMFWRTKMGTKIRGVIPAEGQSFSPTNSDILESASRFNVKGMPVSSNLRGSYGHGKATRLVWSDTLGYYIRRRIKHARTGSGKSPYTK